MNTRKATTILIWMATFFCAVAAVAGVVLFLAAIADSTELTEAQGVIEDPGATAAMVALCAAALFFLCLWGRVLYSPAWKAVATIQTTGVAYLWYADELGKKANDPAVVTDILVFIIAFAVIVGFSVGFAWLMNRWNSSSGNRP